jgi:hypothetical protein
VVRLARSTFHLTQIAENLKEQGIGLKVLDQAIDTTTPTGKLTFDVLAAISEFETAIRKERQMEGIDQAKKRGVRFGRQSKLTTEQIKEMRRKRKTGTLIKGLMAEYNLSKASVRRSGLPTLVKEMMLRTLLLSLALLLSVSACASTKSEAIYVRGEIEGEHVVALSGSRQPWTVEIEKRLRAKGYAVKRFASVTQAIEQVSERRIEAYNQASTRVILHVNGFAPNTAMTRCFGGGYDFKYISAELIDALNNETLATYSNSGFSENCQPLSGTIFGDIVAMVDAVFK